MTLRLSTMRRPGPRSLPLLLAFALLAVPFASALHEAHDVFVTGGPHRYERHDEHAHHGHHAPDDHAECALCAFHRSSHALLPFADPLHRPADPTCEGPALVAFAEAAGSLRLPGSRAPPHLS